jgi:hypothetical protein
MSQQWITDVTRGVPNNANSWVRIPDSYSGVKSSKDLVEGRFDKTAELAGIALENALAFKDKLDTLITDLDKHKVVPIKVDVPDIDYPNVKPIKTLGDSGIPSTVWPSNTARVPFLRDLPTPTEVNTDLPPLVGPEYADIQQPIIGDVERPTTPLINRVPTPEEPSYTLPIEPVITDLVVPTPPLLVIPEFEATLEIIEENLCLPTGFNWESSPYNSEIWETFLQKVLKGLNEGGTGLAPEVEQAIYNRAIYRQQIENDRAVHNAENYFAAKGFTLPPGAVASRVQEISIEILRANTDLNEKIAIGQAELAQKNEHFYVEMARQAEVILREFFSTQENRMLEAAKTTVLMSIEVFKAYISKQSLQIEVYRSHLLAYTESIKATLARVDIYKAEIEAVIAASNLQRTRVELYSAQVGALEVLGKFYNTRLQSVELAQKVENTKIDIFKIEIEAYSAQLAAEKNKVDIFSALNEAERTKAVTFGEKVKARISELEAKKIQFELQVQQLNAVVQSNSAELERYNSELSAYSIQVDSKAKEVGAYVEAYKAEISAYIAENSSYDSYYSAKIKEADLTIQEAKLNLDLQIANISAKNDSFLAIKKLQLGATEGVMNVSSQLTASALSAVNASASFGYSGNENLGHQFSYGAQISESHSIPHDPPQ